MGFGNQILPALSCGSQVFKRSHCINFSAKKSCTSSFFCRGCVQFVPQCSNQGFPLLVGRGRGVKHLGNIACHGKFWFVALSQNILEHSALIQTSKSSSDDMNPWGTWTTPVKRGATTRVSLLQIRKDASGFNVNLCSRVTRCRFHTCKRMSYVPPVFCNKNMLSSASGCCWPPSWLSVGARRRLCNCPSEVEVWQPGRWLRWTLSTLLSESETWKLERIVKTNCDYPQPHWIGLLSLSLS